MNPCGNCNGIVYAVLILVLIISIFSSCVIVCIVTYPQSRYFGTPHQLCRKVGVGIRMNIEAVKPKIAELAEKYDLKLVVLFGSQVTGKTHKKRR